MNIKEYTALFFKGLAMGAADVVPGVSGGTIAFITGIYERLIQAIKSINIKNIKLLFTGKFKEFWKNIDGTFLFILVSGIVVSLLTLAHLMTYLLDNYPITVWAFFFGLILASTIFVGRDVKWNRKTILAFLIFAALAFFVTSPENAPINSNNSYWYICICGAIAICAMILPGISGSFILVLLGQYYFILAAIKDFNIAVMLIFVAGALIGIVSFSHVLSWLFKKFKMVTLASLTGFMFGSLNKIWPWKETITTYEDNHGVIKALTEKNITPAQFGDGNQLFSAILLMITGFVIIFIFEYISLKYKKTE
jgi:putative membrane protein